MDVSSVGRDGSLNEIERASDTLLGHTIGDLTQTDVTDVDPVKVKGQFGELLKADYGMELDNNPEPTSGRRDSNSNASHSRSRRSHRTRPDRGRCARQLGPLACDTLWEFTPSSACRTFLIRPSRSPTSSSMTLRLKDQGPKPKLGRATPQSALALTETYCPAEATEAPAAIL